MLIDQRATKRCGIQRQRHRHHRTDQDVGSIRHESWVAPTRPPVVCGRGECDVHDEGMRYTDFRLLRREPIALDDRHELRTTGDYRRRQEEQRENRGVVRECGEAARRNCDTECLDCARSESETTHWSTNVQIEATIEAVGAYVEAKYTASRPAVSTVVVMGK
jgi:hypothetical protein